MTATDGTLTITQRTLTVTASASSKTYDSTTTASTTLSDDRVNSDDITVNQTSATFSDKNAATGKTVTVSGLSLSGPKAGNYVLAATSVTTTADITPASITPVVSGFTGGVYDQAAKTQTVTITGVGSDGVLYTNSVTGTNAGSYSKAWSYTNSNYIITPSSGTLAFTITPRNALAAYIGNTYFVTSGSSATSAQVTLTASLQDPTGFGLVGATVSFYDISSGTPKLLAGNVKVSPVSGGSVNTGTASTIVTLSTGQYGAESYQIETIVTGNYTNDAQPLTDKTVTMSVVQPVGVNTIKGAGTIARLSTVVGTYAPSGPTAFSVGVSYNKSLTNLQGQVKLCLPQADGSMITIKSNSLTSMTAANLSIGKVTTINAKASIFRVNQDGTSTTIEGNVSLRFDVVGTGSTARVGFTILSGSTLRYSNNWIYDSVAKAWKTDFQGLVTGSGAVNVG